MKYFNKTHLLYSILAFAFFSCSEKENIDNSISNNSFLQFSIEKIDNSSLYSKNKSSRCLEIKGLECSNSNTNLFVHLEEYEGIENSFPYIKFPSRAKYTRTSDLKDFSMTGYTWLSDDKNKNQLFPNLMYNLKVEKSDNWQTHIFWPAKGYRSQFFCYSPHGCAGLVLNKNEQDKGLIFHYNVPTDFSEQKDLMVSKTNVVENDKREQKKVTFTLKHALSGIRLKISSNAMHRMTLKKVELKNIYGTATYTMSPSIEANAYGQWSDWSSKKSFVLEPKKGINSEGGVGDFLIGGDSPESPNAKYTFMMIPQILPDDAQMVVTYTDYIGMEQTLVANIGKFKNKEWKQNYTETYLISDKSISYTPRFNLYVQEGEEWKAIDEKYIASQEGERLKYKIISNIEVTQKGHPIRYKPVPWKLNILSTQEDWITKELNGDGCMNDEGEIREIVVKKQMPIDKNIHDEKLKTATLKKSYNLSNPNGGKGVINTANTYIVNAAGTYKFPLYYGNSVQNGQNNVSSYITHNTNEDALNNLLNSYNDKITHGYIVLDLYNYGKRDASSYGAFKVWEDSPSVDSAMIKNIKLIRGSNYYPTDIEFEVDKENIHQGNAVIALTYKGKVVWSWQIWVTDYELGTELKENTNNGTTYSFLPLNLGWCYETGKFYPKREANIEFTQYLSNIDDGLSNSVENYEIVQEELYEDDQKGNCPLYQFGRKDPFLGEMNGTIKPYIHNPNYELQKEAGVTTIGKNIQNLNIFYSYNNYNSNIWVYDGSYKMFCNLWDGNVTKNNYKTKNKVQKTIYDPSPVGYTVATYSSLDNIIATHDNGFDSGVNVTLSNGDVMYLPFAGCIYGSNGSFHNDESFLWIAYGWQYYGQYAKCLNYSNKNNIIISNINYDAANGFAIRCVKK